MADFLSIPRLNTLTFRRTDNKSTNIQNFDNRLLHEEAYFNYHDTPYYQKFNIVDPILIQITTNYSTKTCELYNAITGGKTDITSGWSTIKTWSTENDGSVSAYDNTIVTTSLSGYYYILLSFNGGITYQSEYFQVDSFSDYTKVQWTHSEIGQFKGIYFAGAQTFMARIESRLVEAQFGLNKIVNESFNTRLENLTTNVKRYVIMELDALPRYLIEKLYDILQIDTLIINDVYYQIEEGATIEFLKEGNVSTNIYTGQLKLREVDYENYDELEAAELIETFNILIDNNENSLLIYGNDKLLSQ
jgi:hypothetical protein